MGPSQDVHRVGLLVLVTERTSAPSNVPILCLVCRHLLEQYALIVNGSNPCYSGFCSYSFFFVRKICSSLFKSSAILEGDLIIVPLSIMGPHSEMI